MKIKGRIIRGHSSDVRGGAGEVADKKVAYVLPFPRGAPLNSINYFTNKSMCYIHKQSFSTTNVIRLWGNFVRSC